MKRPAEILQILDLIAQLDPDASVHIDGPASKSGVWWIDAKVADVPVTFSWTAKEGFGFFTKSESGGYDDRPNELFSSVAVAGRRLAQIVQHRRAGKQPKLGLSELRKLFDVSQEEVAKRSKVKQSAISRVEGRRNVELDTLTTFAGALGLNVRVQVMAPGVTANIEPGMSKPKGATKTVARVRTVWVPALNKTGGTVISRGQYSSNVGRFGQKLVSKARRTKPISRRPKPSGPGKHAN